MPDTSFSASIMGFQNNPAVGLVAHEKSNPSFAVHNVTRQRSESETLPRTNPWALPLPEKHHNIGQQLGYLGPSDADRPTDARGKEDYKLFTHSGATTAVPTPRTSIDLEKQKPDAFTIPIDPHKKDPNQPKLPLRLRLQHFTWAWYTLTMSTGGISTLISIQPHSFRGLMTIGAIFYVANLVFFTILCATMAFRFIKFPGTLKESLKHEKEGLFFPAFWLSVATILTSTQKYVVHAYEVHHPTRIWMVTTMTAAFWIYTFFTFFLAVFQYSYLFIGHTYMLTKMMPSWLLPVFPVMLAGTIAAVIGPEQPISSRMPILVAGLGCQGLGFTVAVIMYSHYIGRLMQTGLPNREHRPGMFIGVGPPSFTCLALIGMADSLPKDFDLQADGLLDGDMLRTLALVAALFLWVLAIWFFMIAAVAVCQTARIPVSFPSLTFFRHFIPDQSTSILDGGPWSSRTSASSWQRSRSAEASKTTRYCTSATP